jgi:hypothetical protein
MNILGPESKNKTRSGRPASSGESPDTTTEQNAFVGVPYTAENVVSAESRAR